jgi:cob(I)alamin adenosyltransferase
MIHAYIGEGKGKTTAGIGLIIRAYGANKKTALIAFDKGSKSYRHSEFTVFDKLGIMLQALKE